VTPGPAYKGLYVQVSIQQGIVILGALGVSVFGDLAQQCQQLRSPTKPGRHSLKSLQGNRHDRVFVLRP